MENKVFNTRVTIRGDIAANWAEKNPVLLKNELAIELGATPAENKFKVGDGVTAWNDLGYSYDLNAILAKIPTGGKITTVTKTSLEASDASVLAAIESPQNGDIAVVKTVVAGVEYELSSYYYSKVDSDWVAISGTVDAEKVILRKDIILAGNYTSVGNLSKGSAAATKTMEVKGKSVAYALEQMLSKEEQPTIAQQVSASVTLTGAGAKEVGSTFTPAYTTTFSKGKYSFKPEDTGVKVTAYEITDTNGNSASAASGDFDGFTVADDANYKITAKFTYSDGAVALTNLGNASNPVVQIKGGSTTKTTAAVTGFRPMFTYVGTDVGAVDGAWIRSKCANKGNSVAPGTLTVAEGTKRVLFAVPKSKNKTLTSVIDVDGMGLDVKDNFTHEVIAVNGANGYQAADYDVWYVDNANGLSATKYTVTLG